MVLTFSSSRLLALFFALLVLTADFATKVIVQMTLPLAASIPVFNNFFGIEFSIAHAINHGAAWGIFAAYQPLLLVARMIMVAGLILYFCLSPRHPTWRLPLALVIAGAVGNIVDTILYGHVVDMLQFVFWGYHYPVFNLADSSIFVGIVALLILSRYDRTPASL